MVRGVSLRSVMALGSGYNRTTLSQTQGFEWGCRHDSGSNLIEYDVSDDTAQRPQKFTPGLRPMALTVLGEVERVATID